MPKPTKASIRYKSESVDPDDPSGGGDQILRFNAVMVEDHEASSEITKFPVESGELVSTHAITKNRKVSIKGIITNTPLDDPNGEFVNYGVNNQKIVFDVVKLLIRNKTPCEVLTNLGIYDPVIFSKFKTAQKEGMTDAMEFTISGEEVQIGTVVGGGTPTPLVFSALGLTDSLARFEDMRLAGYDVSEDSILSESDVDLSKDFSYITTDEIGNKKRITYRVISVDQATGVIYHEVSVTNIPTTGKDPSIPDQGDPSDAGVLKGVPVAVACLAQQTVQAITGAVDDAVDTALGKLKKSTYGFLYDKLGVNGNSSYGQLMLGIALDCFIAGAVGTTTGELTSDDFPVDLPSTDSILQGASNIGNNAANSTLAIAAPTTLTKISPANGGGKKFFGDIT